MPDDVELPVGSPDITVPDDASTDAPGDAAPEDTDEGLPQESAPDPTSQLLARLESIEGLTRQQAQQVRSELGRAQRVEREFNEFREQIGTLPEPDDSLSVAIASALIESPLLDDRAKSSLQTALDRVSSARTAREQAKREAELEANIIARITPPAPITDDAPDPVLVTAQVRLQSYAEGKGIDFASLGTELDFRPGETVDAAYQRVRGVIDQRAADGSAGERTAQRRQAAGGGSPSRAGAATTIEQVRQRLMDEGLPITAEAERRRIAEELGVTL